MQYPYQCLRRSGNVLIAASISCIDTFDLQSATKISSWSCPLPTGPSEGFNVPDHAGNLGIAVQGPSSASVDIVLDSSPPSKRRKLSDETNGLSNKDKQKTGKPARPIPEAPAIIALASTRNNKHVIVVTGEDKTIRVFEHDGRGGLQQISERAMPKRPCAVAITTDDKIIICADKFGDVYSLPLIPLQTDAPIEAISEKEDDTASTMLKPFVSAASDLTIHTARNRKALQNQLRQNQKPSEKTEPKFEHKLLLGHVSMLTDLAVVVRKSRSYIITADRDEHIRISRGIPQAHIIENYCLGHENFITRLCVPISYPNILLSGGGDDEIYVWDIFSGHLLCKSDLRIHAEVVICEAAENIKPPVDGASESASEPVKICVSSIQFLDGGANGHGYVVVICQGVPALFLFSLAASGELSHADTLLLLSNPLAIEANGLGGLIVSLDYLHEPASTKSIRSESNIRQSLQTFEIKNSKCVEGINLFDFQVSIADAASKDDYTRISGLLYGLENLRKRGGED